MAQREKTDPVLGQAIHEHLMALGVETPFLMNGGSDPARLEELARHFTGVMNVLGLDLKDDSLQDTPKRVAKMYLYETFYGLEPENFPKITVVENKFKYDEMLVEKNIGVMSCCEHHFQNIVGYATVAYIPNGKVVGLSKLNRVVDYFSRRPQVQERLTAQVFHALRYVLGTDDVAVVIEADHFCVKARGIQDMESSTVTSKLGGAFKDDPATRAEFMALSRKRA
jgi:GTP cyclohydrolase I